MPDDDEAREAFERAAAQFHEMAGNLRRLGESIASCAEAFASFAEVAGHPVKCSVPCPACDDNVVDLHDYKEGP